jgi:hypothetical protein
LAAGVFPAEELLALWERAAATGPIDRPRVLLAAARPEWPEAALDRVGLGQREAWLLDLRRRLFGDRLRGVVTCPDCASELAVSLTSDAVVFDAPRMDIDGCRPVTVTARGYVVEGHTPDAADLAAAATAGDVLAIRAALVARCVRSATRDAEPVDPRELPDEVIAALGAAIVQADPQAELLLDVVCALCGRRWAAMLDAAAFLWKEIDTAARRLLDEVATLARAFGWSEGEVLALSPTRRRTYVERALDG